MLPTRGQFIATLKSFSPTVASTVKVGVRLRDCLCGREWCVQDCRGMSMALKAPRMCGQVALEGPHVHGTDSGAHTHQELLLLAD
eukprot:364078-Chlamydomonas_euryale.AAC.4